jgi:hypothetical protein
MHSAIHSFAHYALERRRAAVLIWKLHRATEWRDWRQFRDWFSELWHSWFGISEKNAKLKITNTFTITNVHVK